MSFSREQLLQIQAGNRVYQARADDAFAPWGMRAPEPIIGEDPDHYRRRLLIEAKFQLPEDHEYRDLRIKRLPSDALAPYEDLIYPACKSAAKRPDFVAIGETREVTTVNPVNGHKEITFLGRESFIKEMKPPVRYVLGFRTPDGFMNTSGRLVRR